ncbi:MAG: OmpA family protein, partial [Bacteroidota bacterium]
RPVNSSLDDISIFIDRQENRGLFTSSRSGGDDDIYLFWINGLPDSLQQFRVTPPEAIVEDESTTDSTAWVGTTNEQIDQPTLDSTPLDATTSLPDSIPQIYDQLSSDAQFVPNMVTTVDVQAQQVPVTTPPIATALVDSIIISPDSLVELSPTPIPVVMDSLTEQTPKDSIQQSIPPRTKATIPSESSDKATLVSPQQQASTRIVPTESLLVRKQLGPEIISERLPSSPEVIGALAVVPNQHPEVIALRSEVALPLAQLARDLKTRSQVLTQYYRFPPLAFEMGSFLLSAEMEALLEELLQLLQQHPALQIELMAHTFSIGSDTTNQILSAKRSTALRQYFLQRGVDPNRILANGYGEQFLLNYCSNGVVCTQAEHDVNERIELRVIAR